MRDPNRIDVFCNELAKLWHRYPDFRFGQMMENIFATMHDNVYWVEDDEMLEVFRKWFDSFIGHSEDI